MHSLNAPAVRLASDLGLQRLHRLFLDGGLATLDRPASYYGLPLVLGAGEVRLVDLVNLFASLADGGVSRPFHVREQESDTRESRLLSRESAWLVTAMLKELGRPDLPAAWELTRDVPAVAWKTGTSYGHRDAWAVGFSEELTIGVWVGNFDGRGVKGISGSTDAAPLLFDLFRSLQGNGARLRRPSGLEVETVEVCALSHQLPGPWCGERRTLSTLPGRTVLRSCERHRRLFVDAETGHLLVGDCLAGRTYRSERLTILPPELAAWRRSQGETVARLPVLDPQCGTIPAGAAPRIGSPDASGVYLVRAAAPLEFQKIPLQARAGPYARTLYWYQDGELVGSGSPSRQILIPARPGEHRLVVVDDTGRSHAITYRVASDRRPSSRALQPRHSPPPRYKER